MRMRIELTEVLPAPAGWIVTNGSEWAPLYATGVCAVYYRDDDTGVFDEKPVKALFPLVWDRYSRQIAMLCQEQDWGFDGWHSESFDAGELVHWTQALAKADRFKLENYSGLEEYVKGCRYVR